MCRGDAAERERERERERESESESEGGREGGREREGWMGESARGIDMGSSALEPASEHGDIIVAPDCEDQD